MASIKIYLRNKPNRKGLYPVILKIIKDRKIKIITLKLECRKTEWDQNNNLFKRSYPNHIQSNRVILNCKDKAFKIINDFTLEGIDFTLHQFEQRFRAKKVNQTTVREYWEEKVEDLNRAKKTANAKVYLETMNSFFKFAKNKRLKFHDIDARLLEKYETFMFENGSSNGGVSVRMRTLRALFNNAIKNDLIDETCYPFKKYKISKLKSNPIKRAISREDVLKVINLNLKDYPQLLDAQRLFIFSYFTRGMNFHDMINLKWSNIENGKLTYIRSKTKGKFTIEILRPVEDILKHYQETKLESSFIFPILMEKELNPVAIQKRKDSKLKKYNSDLKSIAKIAGIEVTLTSYVVRHSYATNLKHIGVPTDIITESMGHANQQVTQVYLKNFDTTIIDEANKKLLEEPASAYVA